MKKAERGARLLALVLALMLLMTSALAEDVPAPEAEAAPAEAGAFMLEGDGAEEAVPVEDAAPAEPAPVEDAAPEQGEDVPAGEDPEAQPSVAEDPEAELPVAKAQGEYVPVNRSMVVSSSGNVSLYIGDILSVTYSRGAITSLTSSDTKVVEVLSTEGAGDTAVFRALKAGKATLKAKVKGKSVSVKVTVADPYVVTAVQLPGSAQKVDIDRTLTLTAALTPETGRTRLNWSSSKPKVATVKDGVVTPVSEGTTEITVKTENGKKDSVKVTVVNPYKPTGIGFAQKSLSMNVGERLTLSPVIKPDNAITGLTWSSSRTKVANVVDGEVEARAEGSATITVKTDNGKKATVSIKVYDPYKPQDVDLPEQKLTLGVGERLTLTPVLTPATAITTYTWTTSKSKVATVTNGEVEARAEGTATITVRTANGKKASVSVTVKDYNKPDAVALTAQYDTVAIGGTLILTPVLTPATAITTYTWTTSKSKVATVKDGVVTGSKEGTAEITVKTANGKKAKFTVRVVAVPEPTKVTLTESASLEVGDSVSLSARVQPDTADPTLRWSSSNEAVALVRNGVVTGVSGGNAVITATAVNGVQATCRVTVAGSTEYRALLVGNDNFYNFEGVGSGWSRISYNSKAVERMKTTLEGVRGPDGSRYAITTRIDLTESMLKSAIAETFAEADEKDVSLFFLSSHGQLGSGRLVMASVTEKTSEYMSLATLRDCLLAVPGKVIVILDTCGSGASIYLSKGAGGSTSDPVAEQLADFDAAVVKAFASADPGVYEYAPAPAAENDSGDEIFAKTGELRVSNKFYVLCSAAYNEESYAYVNGSFFTNWVSEGIGASGNMPADTQYGGNSNGQVDLHELYKYVSGVGDDHKFNIGGSVHYQHVQVYPADTRYEMFR